MSGVEKGDGAIETVREWEKGTRDREVEGWIAKMQRESKRKREREREI